MTFNEVISLASRYLHRINDIDITQKCGLAEGTNSATLKTTLPIVYSLSNVQYNLFATDNIAMTACAQQAISTFCYYLVSVNATGTVTVTKGTDNAYALPSTPAGSVAIGAFKVTTDASHTFTSGTTDLSATGITAVFYDIDCGIMAQLINQAMRQMERKYNFRNMKVRTTFQWTTADDRVANPITNYKEMVSAYALSSGSIRYPLMKKDAQFLEMAYAASETGTPSFIAETPADEATLTPDATPTLQWMIRRKADSTYTIYMTAYQYTPFLDGVIYASNWWTNTHPDILLYGALVEAEPYIMREDRMPLWKSKLQESLQDLIKAERQESVGGSIQYTFPDYVA